MLSCSPSYRQTELFPSGSQTFSHQAAKHIHSTYWLLKIDSWSWLGSQHQQCLFYLFVPPKKSHLLNLVWSQIPPPTFPVDLHPTCRCSHPSDPPHSLTATALQVRVYCGGPCRCWTDLSSTVSTAAGDNIIVICCRLEGCCNQNTQQVESWLTLMLPIRDYCHKLLPKMVALKNYPNKQLHQILSPISLCYLL